jgi:hypothetical protein
MEQMKIDELTLLFHSTEYLIQVLYDLVGEDVALRLPVSWLFL